MHNWASYRGNLCLKMTDVNLPSQHIPQTTHWEKPIQMGEDHGAEGWPYNDFCTYLLYIFYLYF